MSSIDMGTAASYEFSFGTLDVEAAAAEAPPRTHLDLALAA